MSAPEDALAETQPVRTSHLAAAAALACSALPASAAPGDPRRPPAIRTEEVPTLPEELVADLQRWRNVRQAAFSGWAPDGRGMLVATRFGDTVQLHRVLEPGSRREQLTFCEEPVSGRFLPGGASTHLLCSRGRGGDENDQLYLLDLDSRRETLLTDGTSRNTFGTVSRDGKLLVLGSNRRDPAKTDLWALDPRDPATARRVLAADDGFWNAEDLSADRRLLLLTRYVSINESYPYLLDLSTGERRPLPPPPGASGRVAYDLLSFSPDAKTVWMATDARGEFRELAAFEIATGTWSFPTPAYPGDVEDLEVDPLSGAVAFATNEEGRSRLRLLAVGGQVRDVGLPVGIVARLEFSPDGEQLGLTLDRSDGPAEAWSVFLEDGAVTQWTFSETGDLPRGSLVAPRLVRFPSFDGREVTAWIFRPPTASAERPVPVVIDIHGGPEGQWRPSFQPMRQYWAGHLGFAVVAPNVRGSFGFGKTWLTLDDGMKREDSVKDVGALLDWIGAQPDLDASRVAVHGGSYGGYMVLASLEHFPERLRAGVDVVGIANFTTFLERTGAYRQDLRRVEYGDERDPAMRAFFAKISPVANAEKIRSALLVAHGENDPRVPLYEAEQIAAAVRAKGRPVWTVIASNEGHGFGKKPNRDYLDAVIAMFFRESLR